MKRRYSPKGFQADFISRVASLPPSNECIPWPGPLLPSGRPGPVGPRASRVTATQAVLEAAGFPKPGPDYHAAHAPVVCHNRACINPAHLRWATPQENSADMELDGTRARGSRHGLAKLTETTSAEIRAEPKTPIKELAARFGVSISAIKDVRSGRTWAHV